MPNPERIIGDKKVLDAFKKASARKMTPEERHQQKVSFIMGTIGSDSTLTREDVQRILEEHAR